MAINAKSQDVVVGLDELMKAFAQLGDDAIKELKPATNQAGNVILQKAKSKVGVDSGDTKRSLKLTGAKIKKNAYAISASIGAGKGAAPLGPLELGHKMVLYGKITGQKVEGKPFLRPAADESKEEVSRIMANAMNEILGKMGGAK